MTDKRKRRRFQFILRALLVFVLIVSIGMSWLGVKFQRARKQRAAVEVIEKAGADVTYEHITYNGYESSVPRWACAVFGEDLFFDVAVVYARLTEFGDDEAAYLKVLTDLFDLDLSGTQVTDAGLEHLEGLNSLEQLNLDGTQVTDAGLKHLEGLTSLESLDLRGTQVTTQAAESLRQALPDDCHVLSSWSPPHD